MLEKSPGRQPPARMNFSTAILCMLISGAANTILMKYQVMQFVPKLSIPNKAEEGFLRSLMVTDLLFWRIKYQAMLKQEMVLFEIICPTIILWDI